MRADLDLSLSTAAVVLQGFRTSDGQRRTRFGPGPDQPAQPGRRFGGAVGSTGLSRTRSLRAKRLGPGWASSATASPRRRTPLPYVRGARNRGRPHRSASSTRNQRPREPRLCMSPPRATGRPAQLSARLRDDDVSQMQRHRHPDTSQRVPKVRRVWAPGTQRARCRAAEVTRGAAVTSLRSPPCRRRLLTNAEVCTHSPCRYRTTDCWRDLSAAPLPPLWTPCSKVALSFKGAHSSAMTTPLDHMGRISA